MLGFKSFKDWAIASGITVATFLPYASAGVEIYSKLSLPRWMQEQERVLGIRHFGKPKIETSLLDSLRRPSLGGFYTPSTNTITIADIFDAKNVAFHELGHFYVDTCREAMPGSWINARNPIDSLFVSILDEGIGEYFQRRFSKEPDGFKDKEWPREFKEYGNQRVKYDGGYHLVKPLFDKFGAGDDVMKCILRTRPTLEEIRDPPAYIRRLERILGATK